MLRTVPLALLALLLFATTASAQEPTPLPAAPAGEAEPNDKPAAAAPIAAGQRIRALHATGDVDLYRFSAEPGDRVFAAAVSIGNPRLALLGPDGTTVIETDDDGGTLGAQSSSIAGAPIPAAGTYYLRVDAPRPTALVGPYDVYLEVQPGDAALEAEPNGGDSPQSLGDARFVSGTRTAGDADRFRLDLEPGDTVFVSLDLDPERDGESFNGLLAFGQQILALADDRSADGQPSEAYVGTVDSAGAHYVAVDATAAAASGTYQLSITVFRAVPRSCRTYTTAPAAGEVPDLGAATFPIEVTDAATIDHAAVRLDVTHSYMPDLDATLQAPGGNQIALFGDIGGRPGGPHTRMLTLFDDDAATLPAYESLRDIGLQPLPGGSLGLLAGRPAAGTWKLTLRDDARDDTGALARAELILCSRPEEGPVEPVFSAGFESGDDGFTHSGAADEWERGTPATAGNGAEIAALTGCAGGTSCFKTDLDGTYEPNSSQDLVSPPISLEGRSGEIYASWELWYQLEGAHYDHFTVSVEEDGGARARTLFTWFGGDMAILVGSPLVRIAATAGWARHRADVSDYAGRTIRLRFHLDSDRSEQRSGVAIDDVRVYQPVVQPPAPVAAAEPPAAQAAAVDEPAATDFQLDSRCVRRSADGRVRVGMTMRPALAGAVRVRVDRAVGSRGRSSCPKANPERNRRFRHVATFRRVATARAGAAAAMRRVTLDLRLRPGLYRLTVRVGGSAPVRRFMRVVG